MNQIAQNLNKITAEITTLLNKNQRTNEIVTLLAVSKTKPITLIQRAYESGQIHFGENYLQEAIEKINALQSLPLIWHFIGPIQSNKTRLLATHFDWVQTITREKIAKRLHEQRPQQLKPLNVLIQVNISGESQKSGVTFDEIIPLAKSIQSYSRLKLRGLMAIGHASDTAQNETTYRKLHAFYTKTKSSFGFDTLSLGMTHDMPQAIANGSTMVRIGTGVFERI